MILAERSDIVKNSFPEFPGFYTHQWYSTDDYDLEYAFRGVSLSRDRLGLVIETTITTELVFDTCFDGNIYTPRREPVVRFMLISMI